MNKFNITTYKYPCEYAIIEDAYTSSQLNLIWQELDFLLGKLHAPDKTGTATEDNKYLKQASGIFLDEIYTSRSTSNILQLNRWLWDKEVVEYLQQSLSSWWKLLSLSNKDSTLLNYYSDTDYYKPHMDLCIFTAITVFYKTPLNFIGGDFVLLDKVIPLKSNSTLVFPGHVSHAVTPVKLIDSTINNSGRYSLAQFITINI